MSFKERFPSTAAALPGEFDETMDEMGRIANVFAGQSSPDLAEEYEGAEIAVATSYEDDIKDVTLTTRDDMQKVTDAFGGKKKFTRADGDGTIFPSSILYEIQREWYGRAIEKIGRENRLQIDELLKAGSVDLMTL